MARLRIVYVLRQSGRQIILSRRLRRSGLGAQIV